MFRRLGSGCNPRGLKLGQKFKKSPREIGTSGESDMRRPAHVSGKPLRYVMHRTCSCLGDPSNSTFTRLVRRLIPRLCLHDVSPLRVYSILDTPYGLLAIDVSVILSAAQHPTCAVSAPPCVYHLQPPRTWHPRIDGRSL